MVSGSACALMMRQDWKWSARKELVSVGEGCGCDGH